MSKRISELEQLQHVVDPVTVETVVVQGGTNHRMPLSALLEHVTAEKVGLGQVDNTPDDQKPVSTPQQQALDGKADANHAHSASEVQGLEEAIEDKVFDLLGSTDGFVMSGRIQW